MTGRAFGFGFSKMNKGNFLGQQPQPQGSNYGLPQYLPPYQQASPPPPPGQFEPQAPYGYPQYQQAPPSPPVPTGYDFHQLKITKDSILVIPTNQLLYNISRPNKKSIAIGRPGMGNTLGTIRFHTFGEDVDLAMQGRTSTIKMEPLIGQRWDYKSLFSNGVTFSWFEEDDLGLGEEESGTLTLKDAKKHGRVLAKLSDGVLTFQMPGLSPAMMDEIILSAVGMSVAVKGKHEEEAEVLDFVGNLLGS